MKKNQRFANPKNQRFLDRLRAFGIHAALGAPIFPGDEEKTRVAGLLNPLLLGSFITVIFGLVAALLFFTAKAAAGILLGFLFLVALASKLLLQRGRVRQGSLLLLVALWIVASGAGVVSVNGNPFVAVTVSLAVLAGLLLGRESALIALVASSIFYLGLAILRGQGVSLPAVFPITNISTWVVLTMALVLVAGPLTQALRGFQGSLERARQANQELEARGQQLELAVSARTNELSRRTSYLGATTAIAGAMSTVQQDTKSLLERVVGVISDQFGFYHTGLFLLDATETWAVLQAASSVGGKRMLARGHRLRAGAEGIVGTVAVRGEVRMAQDVGQDAVFFNNPDLPETHSEIALPLRARSKIIGVLDVQSKESRAFTAEDVVVLQAIADQVAVAIANADLLRQVAESVEAERRLYAERSREAWQLFLRQHSELSYSSDEQGTNPFDVWEPRMQAAVRTGELVRVDAEQGAIALPLKVREQVIGVLDGRKPDGAAWTESELTLLQVLAEQLSVALESGRLYRDTQLRAARERLVGEVSGRIRETLDLETMLRTAAEQMRQALDLEDLIVRLAPATPKSGVEDA
ncbi:MAG: fused phosphoenolpyruvate-protein phosphotransferase PtsP/GAF domain protein [Chloroflexi bacterium ADurb.Bin360]|nr:MAG: fused phosphoenolpyruvate-protein phosphotransferase PtsP/GAF domain protein [Chloroflexi bacterium ADurb.Bin360]